MNFTSRLMTGSLLLATVAAPPANLSAQTSDPAPALREVDRSIPHPAVSIGHQQTIETMFASPDGKKLFTSDGGNLRAWDVASQKEISLVSTSAFEWRTQLDATRKWMFRASWENFSILNYETLQPAGGGPINENFHFVWDEQKGRAYVSTATAICELVEENGAWRQKQRFRTDEITIFVRKVILLDDGHLLVAGESGYGILDTTTWKIVRRDDNDPREFEQGPAGVLFALTELGTSEKPRRKIERLSLTDFFTQATIELPHRIKIETNAYDPHTNTFGLIAGDELLFIDLETLKEKTRVPVKVSASEAVPSALTCIQETGEWIVAAGTKLMQVNPATRSLTAAFDGGAFHPRRIVAAQQKFELLATDTENNVKRIRFSAAGVQISDFAQSMATMAYAPDGATIAHSRKSETRISISESASFPALDYDLFSDATAKTAPGNGHVFYSPDGNILGMRNENSIRLIALDTGKIILQVPTDNIYDYEGPGSVIISPDNSLLIAYSGKNSLIGVAIKTQKTLWTEKAVGRRAALFFLSPDTFGCVRAGAIEYRSSASGGLIMDAPIEMLESYVQTLIANVSPDAKRIAVYDGKNVQVFDAETGDKLVEQPSFAGVRDITFLGSSRYVVTAGYDSLLRIIDIEQKRELCSLALFTGTADWVASAPDFRFDACEKGVSKMYVVNGASITPLESLFDQLYTPKLTASLFAGEKLPPPAVDFTKLSPPPNVRLEFSEYARNLVVEDDLPANTVDRDAVQVHATATAVRSALRELRLFQNGKLITSAPVHGAQQKQPFEVKLVPGENIFRVIALNDQGTESRPAEVTVTYRPKAASATANTAQPPSGLQLHLLIVGVNTYKNPKYNLNYAVADATAVKEKIEAQTKGMFTGVNVKFIINDQALKSSIADAFKELTAKAGPRDVLIFYYAGHGVMTSDDRPEFFLVPHDVTQLYGADDALRQKGLSSAELQEFAKAMPAQKQLFILDACQSAGALTTVAMRGAAEEKAIAQLARSTGTHWLTASGSEQFATEFAQLGHGAFTYALIEGLSGRADTGDGRVTVNELKAFLESEVPEITQKHKGTPQFPSSYGFGQDFPVSVVRQN